jgi:dienelactone hydrolase
MKQIKNYGSWQSPITAELILADAVSLGDIYIDREDLYWLEARPQEKGRNVLVRKDVNGKIEDITPSGFNVRTRVHEYGGGAVLIQDGVIYFCNDSDQCIYRQVIGEAPQLLTPYSSRRYADFVLDKYNNRLLSVVEEHIGQKVNNYIASIDLHSGEVIPLLEGYDFYYSPRLSPDGKFLAWLSWNHPFMPWDAAALFLAPLDDLNNFICLAGGENESICEPRWFSDGELYFVSDRHNWWNLYSYSFSSGIKSLCPMEAEFGYPHWVFGLSNYGFTNDNQIVCSYSQNGSWHLATIDPKTGYFSPVDSPYTNISSLQVHLDQVFFLGGTPNQATGVIKLDLSTKKFETLKLSSSLKIDEEYLSEPEAISFATSNGETAYAWLYLPKNKDYQGPNDGTLPPLLVKSHGGPTAAASVNLNLRLQYWTSRGFAYLDVNYGGSTGYGRAYRQRLDGQWGIVDVEDCLNGALHLVKQGIVDPEKLAISGGSAGGYTTLAALTFHDLFKAGASYYGVSDLEALAKDTHKFEAYYLDSLIGKYPQEQEKYQQRSPINFTERLNCPVIFLQGLEDKIVPANQAQMMVNALKSKGIAVAYLAFENEQHGFRIAENIKLALDGEFYFYAKIFKFSELDNRQDIKIYNLAD